MERPHELHGGRNRPNPVDRPDDSTSFSSVDRYGDSQRGSLSGSVKLRNGAGRRVDRLRPESTPTKASATVGITTFTAEQLDRRCAQRPEHLRHRRVVGRRRGTPAGVTDFSGFERTTPGPQMDRGRATLTTRRTGQPNFWTSALSSVARPPPKCTPTTPRTHNQPLAGPNRLRTSLGRKRQNRGWPEKHLERRQLRVRLHRSRQHIWLMAFYIPVGLRHRRLCVFVRRADSCHLLHRRDANWAWWAFQAGLRAEQAFTERLEGEGNPVGAV